MRKYWLFCEIMKFLCGDKNVQELGIAGFQSIPGNLEDKDMAAILVGRYKACNIIFFCSYQPTWPP